MLLFCCAVILLWVIYKLGLFCLQLQGDLDPKQCDYWTFILDFLIAHNSCNNKMLMARCCYCWRVDRQIREQASSSRFCIVTVQVHCYVILSHLWAGLFCLQSFDLLFVFSIFVVIPYRGWKDAIKVFDTHMYTERCIHFGYKNSNCTSERTVSI